MASIGRKYDPDETEFTSVPLDQQLDHDDDGSSNTNAITEEKTADGVVFFDADDDDLDDYRDRSGPIWKGE